MKDFHENTKLALIVIDIQKSDFADIDSEDKAIPEKTQAARNFPKTALVVDTGSVMSSSRVPDFRSSAQSLMATAGIKNR